VSLRAHGVSTREPSGASVFRPMPNAPCGSKYDPVKMRV
jgi:hypothetical protein